MKITISGRPGSGKSTVAKYVAKRLGFTHYSMGDLQRQIAEEKGVSLAELWEMEEQDKSLDNLVDARQKKIGEEKENFVIDSRIGFYFIPDSVKVFLDVDSEVGAKRVFNQKRGDERFSTLEKTRQELRKRVDSEKKRYMKYYKLNHYDMKNYDIVIDTTGKSAGEVGEEIVGKVKKKTAQD